MKDIFGRIWSAARPIYQKGRPMDVSHILWMMNAGFKVCRKERIDDTILIPVIILHDIGYGLISSDNPYNIEMRRLHMQKGAERAKAICESFNYPVEKIKLIEYYISVHDNWVFGDHEIYHQNIILGVFNDLDFIWMATAEGFLAVQKIRQVDHLTMVNFLKKNEKLVNRPFCTKTTKEMFEKYIQERMKGIRQRPVLLPNS